MLSICPASTHAPVRVLFVEDDAEISRMLMEILAEDGIVACTVISATELDQRLAQDDVDLIVLDVMLPGDDGFSICRRLRAGSSLPIIILTALGEDVDRILGIEFGVDDYVSKPFNSRELVARIRALLRRARFPGAILGSRLHRFGFAGWRIDPIERQLRSPQGVRVTTTSAEFDLLLAFCQNPGRILSREQLLDLTYSGRAGPIERRCSDALLQRWSPERLNTVIDGSFGLSSCSRSRAARRAGSRGVPTRNASDLAHHC
jgi:two-component system, OmpR family, response regulator